MKYLNNYWKLSLLFSVAVGCLSACNRGDAAAYLDNPFNEKVLFAFPVDGQQDVPVGSPVFIKYQNPPLFGGTPGLALKGDSTLQTSLLPGNDYDLKSAGGRAVAKFRTRHINIISGAGPQLLRHFPDPRANQPFMDFASLRLLFSEDLNPDTLRLNDTFIFTDAQDQPVAGRLLHRGSRITFDPDVDLRPDETYRLRITTGLKDVGGENLDKEIELQFNTVNSGKRIKLTLGAVPVKNGPFDGLPVGPPNTFLIKSSLVDEAQVQVIAGLAAEIGDLSIHQEILPILIRSGARIQTTPLDVMLAGRVPAGLNTGPLSLTLVTDAVGFAHGDPSGGPTRVRLMLDVILTAADSRANGGLNQDIMHVEAVGTLSAADGNLVIDLVGAVELDLLGLERSTAVLNLHLETTAQPLTFSADRTPPEISSVFPESGDTLVTPDTALVLSFTRPLLEDDLKPGQNIRLTATAGPTDVPFSMDVQGSSLRLIPDAPLSQNTEYQVTVDAGLRDLDGNLLADGFTSTFRTREVSALALTAPLAYLISPGPPCALDPTGYCLGGEGTDDLYSPDLIGQTDSLEVRFSRDMDTTTMQLESTDCGVTASVQVVELDSSGACVSDVPGELALSPRGLRFTPRSAWRTGVSYEFIMRGGADTSCDAGEICATDGMPLNTDLLVDGAAGGPEIRLGFQASSEKTGALLTLSAQEITDLNGNGLVDADETLQSANRVGTTITDFGGIVTDARYKGDDGIYLSGSMTAVAGAYDDFQGGMALTLERATLYGTSLGLEVDAHIVDDATITATGVKADTERLLFRVRGRPTGYVKPGPTGPEFEIALDLYLDAPQININVLGLLPVSTDMQSKELTLKLRGPLTFRSDGRLEVNLSSTEAVSIMVNLSLVVPSSSNTHTGFLELTIPQGSANVKLSGPPVRRLFADGRY